MLAVDLDHTLIKTDLLHETFFQNLAQRPVAAVKAVLALRKGRAALKAGLAEVSDLDVATLPYNQDVLAYIDDQRRAGTRVALVSASDERLVKAVAAHLGCFDEAYGSNPEHNLKGEAKARFLVERYGAGQFDYVGDSRADLAVWKQARRAIAVNAKNGLGDEIEKVAREVHHLGTNEGLGARLKAYVRALRPHQWLKNALVFLPILAAHVLTVQTITAAFLAFVAFSLTASSVYVLNDLLDLAADRAHPRKRSRPFASGRVPILHGLVMAPLLLISALVIALAFLPSLFLLVLFLYYVVTTLYSFVLKRLLVIDICALAGLYTLRVMAGAAATALPISPWMLGFSVFLFLSLAAIKRQTELVDGIRSGRSKMAGRAYEADDLPIVSAMAIASGYAAVLVLALYVDSDAVKVLYRSPLILWAACPILLYWISRLVMIAHRGAMNDDPVVFAVRDWVSLACGLGILLISLGAWFL